MTHIWNLNLKSLNVFLEKTSWSDRFLLIVLVLKFWNDLAQ